MKNTWSIVEDLSEKSTGMSVLLQNQQSEWPYFFNGIRLSEYPRMIGAVAGEVGAHDELAGVNFPAGLMQLNPDISPIHADSVEIYIQGGEDEVISRALFYEVLEEFAQRLVEQPGHPLEWYDSMQAALAKLRAKMAADAAG